VRAVTKWRSLGRWHSFVTSCASSERVGVSYVSTRW
jgi:hypothetical protein